ncbi:MAG: acyltransferase [Bryobacterales bacterium]|nr:acyltransferase [Bryobacterales bacterium]
MSRWVSFWRKSSLDRCNSLAALYCRAKGLLLYRWVFQSFGSGSTIAKPMLISNPQFISIGAHVSIRPGVRLEAVRSAPHRVPELRIGSGANIEQNVHIVCHCRIHIGENVSITGQCAIVDVTHPYEDIANPVKIGARILDEDSFVEIGDGAFLGIGTVVLPNVRIGRGSVTAARSVVTSDIPDYSVAAGAPAKVIRTYDPTTESWLRVR